MTAELLRPLQAQTSAQELLTSDYLLSLLEGAKLNTYIEGSLECAMMLRDSQYDMVSLMNFFKGELPTENTARLEQTYFNITGQFVKSIPDAGYFCYEMPSLISQSWNLRLAKFEDIQDFSDGFFQNLLGNVLTIQDALGLIQTATDEGDYVAVVYQIGRLFRRMFDFQPMKSASLTHDPKPTLRQD